MNKILNVFILFFTVLLFGFYYETASYAQTLDPNNPAASPDPQILVDLGIKQVRLVLKDDKATKDYVDKLKSKGIKIIGIINWEYNSNAYILNENLPTNYINKFIDEILPKAYDDFGDLYAYQIWNEPDDMAMRGTSKFITPESYAHLLALATAYLHTQGQESISAGFVSGDLSYIERMINSSWGFVADGISYHPYIADPSQPGSIQQVINGINALNSMTNIPVWITEFGWPTSDQQAQANWLAQVYGLLGTAPELKTVMWYGWSDLQNPGFGLLDANMQPKLAMLIFLKLVQGQPLPPDLAAIANAILVQCQNSTTGEFMGYALNQQMCEMYIPCTDAAGKVIGYAFEEALCNQQQIYIEQTCKGPVEIEKMSYEHTWTQKPFKVQVKLVNRGNSNDVASDPDFKDTILWGLTVKANSFDHTDFSTMVNRLAGSLDPANDKYVEKIADPFKCISTGEECQPVLPLVALSTPGVPVPTAFNISEQQPKRDKETYVQYSKRLLSSQDPEKFGTKANIRSLSFIGCMQKDVCNPKLTDTVDFNGITYSSCLKAPDPNNPKVEYCGIDDSPDNCQGIGEYIYFTEKGETSGLEYIENPLINSKKLALWQTTSYMTLPPDYIKLPDARATRGITYSNQGFAGNSQPNYSPADQLPTKNEASFHKKDKDINQNKFISKAKAGTLPPWGTQSCDGLGMVTENVEDQYFAVKLWDTNPMNCGDLSDAWYEVSYTLVSNDGTRMDAGGCSVYITKDNYPRRYDPNADPNSEEGSKQLYGIPVTDWPGCSVNVSPKMGNLEVYLKITSSRSGGGAGCFNQPECGCADDTCRRNTVPGDGLPINCSVCNSWAPPSYCQNFNEIELSKTTDCAYGNCSTPNNRSATFTLENSNKYEDVEEQESILGGLNDWFQQFFGGISDAFQVNLFKCNISRSEGCGDGDPNTECSKGWTCGHDQAVYSIFGYVPKIDGNLETYTTTYDTLMYNSIGLIPGVSNKYFEVKDTKHEAFLSLVPKGTGNIELVDGAQFCSPPGQAVQNGNCIDAEFSFVEDQASFWIKYPTHFQQISQYCLSQAMLSLPDQFPISQAQFCKDILADLRPDTSQALLSPKTRLKNYYKTDGIAYIGPKWPEDSSNKYAKYQGPNMPKETDKKLASKIGINQSSTTSNKDGGQGKVIKLNQDQIKSITPFNQGKFSDELAIRIEVFLNKYMDKYGYEEFSRMSQQKKFSREMQDELYQIRDELYAKYGIAKI